MNTETKRESERERASARALGMAISLLYNYRATLLFPCEVIRARQSARGQRRLEDMNGI